MGFLAPHHVVSGVYAVWEDSLNRLGSGDSLIHRNRNHYMAGITGTGTPRRGQPWGGATSHTPLSSLSRAPGSPHLLVSTLLAHLHLPPRLWPASSCTETHAPGREALAPSVLTPPAHPPATSLGAPCSEFLLQTCLTLRPGPHPLLLLKNVTATTVPTSSVPRHSRSPSECALTPILHLPTRAAALGCLLTPIFSSGAHPLAPFKAPSSKELSSLTVFPVTLISLPWAFAAPIGPPRLLLPKAPKPSPLPNQCSVSRSSLFDRGQHHRVLGKLLRLLASSNHTPPSPCVSPSSLSLSPCLLPSFVSSLKGEMPGSSRLDLHSGISGSSGRDPARPEAARW